MWFLDFCFSLTEVRYYVFMCVSVFVYVRVFALSYNVIYVWFNTIRAAASCTLVIILGRIYYMTF